MDKEWEKDSLKLAGRHYQVEDYQGKDVLSKGLSTTHEQVSDAYMEGEINLVIDDVDGDNIDLNGKSEEANNGGND